MDVKKEFRKIFKFFVVGGSTFVIQAGSYLLFSRLLMPDMDHTTLYVLAMSLSLLFNYSINRAWTFGDQASAQGSARRYAYVVVVASVLNASMFWFGHNILHIYDLWMVVLANVIIPFFTFITHRLYTFHPEPGSAVKRIVRRATDSV